jgi:hypothetical protein
MELGDTLLTNLASSGIGWAMMDARTGVVCGPVLLERYAALALLELDRLDDLHWSGPNSLELGGFRFGR